MKVLWLTRLARPDLAYAVSQLSTQVTAVVSFDVLCSHHSNALHEGHCTR